MYGSLIKDSDSFFQLSAKFFGKFVRIFSEYHADDRQKRFGDLVSRVAKKQSLMQQQMASLSCHITMMPALIIY